MTVMRERDTKFAPATHRGRGSYASQACNFCRLRKTKCSGEKPVCDSCRSSGHECTWGSESAKRPSTKQYVEALKNRIRILESYVGRCRQEHAPLRDDPISDFSLRPGTSPIAEDPELLASDDDEDTSETLRALVLEDQDLQLYGSTSIFQYAPKIPERKSRFPDITERTNECYVLLVDGVDDSAYNPDFDWSRHLPPEVPLERREHDRLLDLLFKFFASWCLRIVPPLFLRDMWRSLIVPRSQSPPKTAHYSPMLHNALIALASAFSDNHRIRDLKSRQYFAELAKSYIDKECQTPNISVVHALSILGSYHASQGDQTLGYMYFGMSGRISQALGLSIDSSPWVKANLISHDDMLDRNWAYWTTFCQDVCWSLYVGREFSVPDANRTTIPVPFVDSDFDQLVWHYPPSGIPPQPTYLSRTFAETCELLRIGRRIMEIVNLLNLPGSRLEIDLEPISKIDVQLNTWKDRLFPEVEVTLATRSTATPHRLMVHLAYWQLFILLHRPFYRRAARSLSNSDKEIDHVKLCNRAADNIMEFLGVWRSLYSLRYVPVTLVQVVFSAGTVFLLSALQATSGVRFARVSLHKSLSQAELCIQYLQEVGRSYQCAKNVAGILANLLQQQLKPKLAMRSQVPSRPATPMNFRPNLQMSSMNSGSQPSSSPTNTVQALHSSESSPVQTQARDAQPSNVIYQIYVQGGNTHMQTDHNPHNTGWAPSAYPVQADSGGNAPGSHFQNTGFGSSPLGLGMMGGDPLPNRPFMPLGVPEPIRYDENFFERQLGLPQGYEQSTAQDPLPDEIIDELQQFLQRQPFDGM